MVLSGSEFTVVNFWAYVRPGTNSPSCLSLMSHAQQDTKENHAPKMKRSLRVGFCPLRIRKLARVTRNTRAAVTKVHSVAYPI